ncbi:hypothetical protein D9613_010894 [Agrocybe pediades]|uniref:Uncharacterized protein n=1 Tax=Agrocybe pediades TaxID=84607 RepID=A0A8H4VJ94_9AGAR|nr:hypothetical protein D9613_010894 [Agrocybe pediades]
MYTWQLESSCYTTMGCIKTLGKHQLKTSEYKGRTVNRYYGLVAVLVDHYDTIVSVNESRK